jgi:hypothetical protein
MPSLLIQVVLLSYALMLAAFFMPRQRVFHISVMASVIAFDIGLPIYLYLHRHWWRRLIEQQEIMSSLVWMHFALLFALYALEGAQIYTGRKLLWGDEAAKADHRSQGKILLVVRGLAILSGAILAE